MRKLRLEVPQVRGRAKDLVPRTVRPIVYRRYDRLGAGRGRAVNKALLDIDVEGSKEGCDYTKSPTKAGVVLTLRGNSRADVMSQGCLDPESRSSKKLAFVKLRKRQELEGSLPKSNA